MWPYNRSNRRLFPDKDSAIWCEIIGKGFDEPLKVKDICIGGVAIYTNRDFRGNEIGGEIQLKLTIPNLPSFTTLCEIRHSELNNSYIGLKFLNLEKNIKNNLREYLIMIKQLPTNSD